MNECEIIIPTREGGSRTLVAGILSQSDIVLRHPEEEMKDGYVLRATSTDATDHNWYGWHRTWIGT